MQVPPAIAVCTTKYAGFHAENSPFPALHVKVPLAGAHIRCGASIRRRLTVFARSGHRKRHAHLRLQAVYFALFK